MEIRWGVDGYLLPETGDATAIRWRIAMSNEMITHTALT